MLGDFTARGVGFEGFYGVPTTTVLRSPVIDLTVVSGAELTFAEALDLGGGDTAQVFVIDNANGAEIGGAAVYSATDPDPNGIGWGPANGGSSIELPGAAGKQVYFEWRFSGSNDEYCGWYIDDVTVIPIP